MKTTKANIATEFKKMGYSTSDAAKMAKTMTKPRFGRTFDSVIYKQIRFTAKVCQDIREEILSEEA